MNAESGTIHGKSKTHHAGRAWAVVFRSFVLGLVWCSSFIVPRFAFAGDVPAAINYEGVLTDVQGQAVTSGYYHIEFRIWDHPTDAGAGSLIWGREFPLHVLTGGVFRILLSDDGGEVSNPTPLTNDLRQAFQEASRHLGLTIVRTPTGQVASPVEFRPRQPLVSVPYAFHSEHAAEAVQANDSFRVEAGALTVASGGMNVSNTWVCHGALTVAGEATVGGTLQVGQTLTVHGATDVHSLHVRSGGGRFDGDVNVAGNLTVESPSKLEGYGTIPIGGIIPWSGSKASIPDGWAPCDGGTYSGKTTPDLRNRFIVGAGSTNCPVGATGGENTHQLTRAEMPSHTHDYTLDDEEKGYAATHTGGYFWRYTTGKTTSHAGDNAPHENRPPYYALYFIMRVK